MTPEEAYNATGRNHSVRLISEASDEVVALRFEYLLSHVAPGESIRKHLHYTLPEVERRPGIRHILVPLKLQGLI